MYLDLAYPFIAQLTMLAAFGYLVLPGSIHHKPPYALGILLIFLIILLIPIKGSPIFYYLRAYSGDLSLSSVVLFAAYVSHKGFGKPFYQEIEVRYLLLTVFLIGLILYPMALGLGSFDPYRLGYQPEALTALLFFLAIYFWLKSYYFLLLIVTTAVAGFTLGIIESNNLWDYLLDTVLWLVSLTTLMLSGIGKLRNKTNV